MSTLRTIVPDAEVLLKLEPEEPAPILLRLGKQNRQSGMFMLGTAHDVRRRRRVSGACAWPDQKG
jgi:hypothetical protein